VKKSSRLRQRAILIAAGVVLTIGLVLAPYGYTPRISIAILLLLAIMLLLKLFLRPGRARWLPPSLVSILSVLYIAWSTQIPKLKGAPRALLIGFLAIMAVLSAIAAALGVVEERKAREGHPKA